MKTMDHNTTDLEGFPASIRFLGSVICLILGHWFQSLQANGGWKFILECFQLFAWFGAGLLGIVGGVKFLEEWGFISKPKKKQKKQ